MGMSIEEAHRILSNGLVNAPSEHAWCVAFKMAIDTMIKYQKIVEIVKNTNAMTGSNGYACAFIKIREVIKDGTND